jgi:hypothetical protein
MSSIVVAGDTSGSITLQAPAVSGSTVLTLPTTSATLITDSSGILNIGSGQVYKDASGNVGIGTSNPNSYGKLVVSGGSTSIDPQLTIESTAFNANQGCALNFARAGFTQPVQVRLKTSDNGVAASDFIIETKVNGTAGALTERMRIDSSGNVTLQKNISVGAAAPTTSGTGITFPSTASPSTDAYTLDDYREGTWTPTLTGFTLVGTASSTYSYTKIGRMVTINAIIYASTSYTVATNATMSLPFTPTLGGTGVAVSENTGQWGVFVANGGNLVFKVGVGASQGITLSFTYIV